MRDYESSPHICNLVRHRLDELHAFARQAHRRLSAEHMDAEDVVAESLVVLLTSPQVPSGADDVVRYAKGVIRRIAARSVRRERRRLTLRKAYGAPQHSDRFAEAPTADLKAAVRTAMRSLPRRTQQIAVRYWLWDKTAPEISAEDGVAVSTIRNQLADARRRLRVHLRPLATDDGAAE
jgi:RNA polymerase sigma factor (sigma-70 family)